jgi:hypothetical protein
MPASMRVLDISHHLRDSFCVQPTCGDGHLRYRGHLFPTLPKLDCPYQESSIASAIYCLWFSSIALAGAEKPVRRSAKKFSHNLGEQGQRALHGSIGKSGG